MRNILGKLFCPITFSNAKTSAQLFESFAATEFSSAMDLLAAAKQTANREHTKLYFEHAQDEFRHGELFSATAKKIRRKANLPAKIAMRPDCENIYEQLGELTFLAFVHRGESRGLNQFRIYNDFLTKKGDKKLAAVFSAVIGDEIRHRDYSLDLLRSLSPDKPSLKKHLRKAFFWEARRRWKVQGMKITNHLFGIFSTLILLSYAPIALLLKTKPTPKKH